MNEHGIEWMLLLSLILHMGISRARKTGHVGTSMTLLAFVLPHWCGLRLGWPVSAEWAVWGLLSVGALAGSFLDLRNRGGAKGRRWVGWWMPVAVFGLGVFAKCLTLRFYQAPIQWLTHFALYDIMSEGFALFLGVATPYVAARLAQREFLRTQSPMGMRFWCMFLLFGGVMLTIVAGLWRPFLVRADVLQRYAWMLPLPGIQLLSGKAVTAFRRILDAADAGDNPLHAGVDAATEKEKGAETGERVAAAAITRAVEKTGTAGGKGEVVEAGCRILQFPTTSRNRIFVLLSFSLAGLCLLLMFARPFGITHPAYPVGEEIWITTDTSRLSGNARQLVQCLSANREGVLALRGWRVVWIPWQEIHSLQPLNRYGQAPVAEVRRW